MPRPATTLSYQGQTLTYAEAARLSQQPVGRLQGRRWRGWSDADCIERPKYWWPGRDSGREQRWGIGAAIAAYLEAHPEEYQRLAAKYGWRDE